MVAKRKRREAHMTDKRQNVPGTIYLIHMHGEGLTVDCCRTARHYLGWTEGQVADRLETHLRGRGAAILRAAVARGNTLEVVRTWDAKDRNFERWLKNKKKTGKMCPVCNPKSALNWGAA